jgi:6,7-dimethyl-8-ribityllumazine synthase
MVVKNQNLSLYDNQELPDAKEMTFGIVTAEWNSEITFSLLKGCKETLILHGAKEGNIHSIFVPGTFELPVAAKMLSNVHKLDAVICLGCVIKGETSHNEYINNSVANVLQQLSVATSKPFIFGVLTPNSMEQALDRAGGKHGNKGVEAAVTAIKMIFLKKTLSEPDKKIGF